MTLNLVMLNILRLAVLLFSSEVLFRKARPTSDLSNVTCSDFDLNDSKGDTKSTAVIVFWSSLINFFGKCFTCFDKSVKITRKVHGSLLIIMMTCSNGHENIWRSQSSINRQSHFNLLSNLIQYKYLSNNL